MTTESRFKAVLKELIETMPLSEVNVTALCDRCDCHRQTFYYHFRDVYDLVAAIFLNEKIQGLSEARDTNDMLSSLIDYACGNFKFLRSVYNSDAHDLVDNFFYEKVANCSFQILASGSKKNLPKDVIRSASRRFASLIGTEFRFCFKDSEMTPLKLERRLRKFASAAAVYVFPALIEAAKEEKKR